MLQIWIKLPRQEDCSLLIHQLTSLLQSCPQPDQQGSIKTVQCQEKIGKGWRLGPGVISWRRRITMFGQRIRGWRTHNGTIIWGWKWQGGCTCWQRLRRMAWQGLKWDEQGGTAGSSCKYLSSQPCSCQGTKGSWVTHLTNKVYSFISWHSPLWTLLLFSYQHGSIVLRTWSWPFESSTRCHDMMEFDLWHAQLCGKVQKGNRIFYLWGQLWRRT